MKAIALRHQIAVLERSRTRPKDPYERARMRMIEDLCDRAFDATGFGMEISLDEVERIKF